MKSGLPSSALERFALALGLVSSLCLAIGAFAAFGDSRNAGWSHLDDLSTRVRSNVREAWGAITRVDESKGREATCLEPASESIALSSPAENERRTPPAPIRAGPMLAPNLFEALLEESGRAELVKHDLPEALSLATEAAQKDAPPEHIAQARLRAIQLAARQGLTDAAHAQWEAARDSIDPAIVTGDTSTLLLCALAALPTYDEAGRAAAVDSVVRAWTSNALVFPESLGRFERIGDAPRARYEWTANQREAALRERLLELCQRPPEWSARFAAFDEETRRAAFQSWVGVSMPIEASRESWSLYPAAVELLAARKDAHGRTLAHLVRREVVEDALRMELTARHALPEGFALDLRGDDAAKGEMVGPWIDLGSAFPRVTLRHPDRESILREVETRTLWMRGGLLVLALFVAGAAIATFLALRRERRLAQARTTFVANVSHELRTPLASILLMAENLEGGKAGDNVARYHSLLKREALRLRRLVDDVLDFSRLERGKRFSARVDEVELASWFDALCADALEMGSQASVVVRCSREESLASASFDREALRRAVLNLVDNALRHSGAKEIELHSRTRGDTTLLLSVSDSGKGIAHKQHKSVFEPFTRLNGSEGTPGAGLGLAIVREIAQAHGGSVVLRDRSPGPGAEFEIAIPIHSNLETAK
jgi:signal transduction histidine kinase